MKQTIKVKAVQFTCCQYIALMIEGERTPNYCPECGAPCIRPNAKEYRRHAPNFATWEVLDRKLYAQTPDQDDEDDTGVELDEGDKNIYQRNGYSNRAHYLRGLADERGLDIAIVATLADALGPEEDFDGLISELNDFEGC